MNAVNPYLLYEDVASALVFLSRAFGFGFGFGFTETLRHDDPSGSISHAEMRRGNGTIMLGDPGPSYRSPKHVRATTVQIHVQVDDVDAAYARARAAGAVITSELEDHADGERRFSVTDPEVHVWTSATHFVTFQCRNGTQNERTGRSFAEQKAPSPRCPALPRPALPCPALPCR
ncbi:glyoxalase/bleomycin resistance/extradiol dioxygenase family protein [Cryobacterium sp. N21]|uniref:VOC family protein n=1 Tax=Cryobacterium sp. N21 TaxID=2048289 RepID=UPI000CE52307|nr:VOC family protein [Cryobacterium sp. N21]